MGVALLESSIDKRSLERGPLIPKRFTIVLPMFVNPGLEACIETVGILLMIAAFFKILLYVLSVWMKGAQLELLVEGFNLLERVG